MCFPYIIKRNFVAKTWIWSVVFILLFTIFICLASVVVGFGYFAVLGCKDLRNNANHLAKWYRHVMRCLELRSPCLSLKIIAHLRMFVSQSDSSIQRPRSISNYNVWRKSTSQHFDLGAVISSLLRTYWNMEKWWRFPLTAIHKSSPVATWDSKVSIRCALKYLTGSSKSSGYILSTVLWILWIQTHYSAHILFSHSGCRHIQMQG